MSRRGTTLLARLALASLILVSAGCTPLDDLLAGVFGRSMRDQASFDPYEDPLNAPDGSVPFASANLPARVGDVNVGQAEGLQDVPPPYTTMDVLNEAEVVVSLENPVEATSESLDRGQELFLRFCAPCHGPAGDGVSGYMLLAGYPPYSMITERVSGFTDGHLYGMIRMGRGNMPAYGHRISHFDRWHVVNYVRVLQGVASPPAMEGGGE
ncbi:MAG: cytochrome c [Gemmatimonadetes bacterium]|nr:cytochrome c [Gemmatimonadota bacterium]